MALRRKEKIKSYLGKYAVDTGSVVGKLKLKGSDTLLRLYSNEEVLQFDDAEVDRGHSYGGECLTLVDCCHSRERRNVKKDGSVTCSLDVFPHFTLVGSSFVNPSEEEVFAIHFTTTDLMQLFNDFDAFGHVIDSKSVIDAVLKEARGQNVVEAGDNPQVCYFTGKDRIVEVMTGIGKISVDHRPESNFGGTSGVFVKNRVVVTIEPPKPITFGEAVERMYTVANFLSVAAGRAQGVDNIEITTTEQFEDTPQMFSVYPSFKWKAKDKGKHHKPHVGDLPLDPVRRPEEFDEVLSNWIGRHDRWRIARSRYLECIRKINRFGADRLVAAANMFDILPSDAIAAEVELAKDFSEAVADTKKVFKKFPESVDRNSVLNALGRLGKSSLPKKVAHRVSIIDEQLGQLFPDLQLVATVAIKCRNYFVHGSAGDLDIEKLEPFIPFLTYSLEFIFSASDFIEAGWDAKPWGKKHFGWGHSFSRFRSEYRSGLAQLQIAIAKEKVGE